MPVEGWQGPYHSKLSAKGNVRCLKAKLWFKQVPPHQVPHTLILLIFIPFLLKQNFHSLRVVISAKNIKAKLIQTKIKSDRPFTLQNVSCILKYANTYKYKKIFNSLMFRLLVIKLLLNSIARLVLVKISPIFFF